MHRFRLARREGRRVAAMLLEDLLDEIAVLAQLVITRGGGLDLEQLGAQHRLTAAAVERVLRRATLRTAVSVAEQQPIGQL